MQNFEINIIKKTDELKPNQDSYSITTDFNNNPNDALFSVYDGHGRYGDKCAQFARDHLPNLIARHIEKTKQDILADGVKS